jgi:hypothetical protein
MSSSSYINFEDLTFDFYEDIYKDIFETNVFLVNNEKNYEELYDLSLRYFERGLLHEKSVWKWLFNDLIFESKNKEDEWGKTILSKNYPSYGQNVMWTGTFGKKIVFEFFQGMHQNAPELFTEKPIEEFRLLKMQPDLYIPKNYIVEVKTSTYLTTGTANEKIFSVPFKYANATSVFQVPKLHIIVVGNSEVYFTKMVDTEMKRQMLDFFYERLNHRFIPATRLLQCISLLKKK